MTQQNLYKYVPNVSPDFNTYINDDDIFFYIFSVPEDKKVLNISKNNAIDTFATATLTNLTTTTIVETTDLYGTLALDYAAIEIINQDNAKLYVAGHNTKSIIFTYINNPLQTKKQIKIGDIIQNSNINITKVLNYYDKLSYLEYDGVLNLTENQIIIINGIQISVKAGSGIKDKAGVIGIFQTDYKNISYYAKFSPKKSIETNITKTDYANYNINVENPFVNGDNNLVNNKNITKKLYTNRYSNDRLSIINTDIISPAISNVSVVNSLNNGIFQNNNVTIDGISSIVTPQIVTSWNKIPYSNDVVSFGISNITPKNNNNNFVQSTTVNVSIKFNWYYSPVIPESNGLGVLIDGWLIQEYTDIEGTGLLSPITYEKDTDNRITQIGFINNNINYVLFAGNDVIYRSTTHELDYNTEPYGSSNVTNLYGIRSTVQLPCKYEFPVSNISAVNNLGGNLNIVGKYIATMTSPFMIGDDAIAVKNTLDFMESGYLQIAYYTVDVSTVGTQEKRIYDFVGVEIISYGYKTSNTFCGIVRGLFNTVARDYPKINSVEFSDWYYSVVSYYPTSI